MFTNSSNDATRPSIVLLMIQGFVVRANSSTVSERTRQFFEHFRTASIGRRSVVRAVLSVKNDGSVARPVIVVLVKLAAVRVLLIR